MKRPRWLLAGLLVILVLTVGITVLLRRQTAATPQADCPWPQSPAPGQVVAAPTGRDSTSIAAPGGGALRVAEKGFSQPRDKTEISMGATLENTSSQVAYRTRVIFRAYLKDGTAAIAETGKYFAMLEIPILRPGQRIAIGNNSYVDNRLIFRIGIDPTISRMDLDLLRTTWAPTAETKSYPEVSARLDPSQSLTGDVTALKMTTTSNACRDLSGRGTSAVFRNSAGAIVGGTVDASRLKQTCQAGTSTASVLISGDAPATADLSRTDVSVLCDTEPTALKRPGPDQPVN
jgi:hypothetical protein